MSFKKSNYSRRQALTSGLAASTALMAAACAGGQNQATAEPAQKKSLVLDYKNPEWNRDAMARIHGNLDFTKEKIGWFKGKAVGVMPGKKNLEICGFEGFSVTRLIPLEDGSYRKLLREVGFYRDMKTGKILETMENPYTGENVRVVPIANDPFNFTIEQYWPQPPNYGGLNAEERPRIPMLLNWNEMGDKVLLTSDIHLFYPSALQPDKWPRESPGVMNQVSEMFRYIIDKDQLGDPDNTSVSFFGTWNRITPWFPWMLMDQAPGHIVYVCDQGACDHWDFIPEDILQAARNIDEKFLSAPTEDYGPSLSSLELYAKEQTPAPPRSE